MLQCVGLHLSALLAASSAALLAARIRAPAADDDAAALPRLAECARNLSRLLEAAAADKGRLSKYAPGLLAQLFRSQDAQPALWAPIKARHPCPARPAPLGAS